MTKKRWRATKGCGRRLRACLRAREPVEKDEHRGRRTAPNRRGQPSRLAECDRRIPIRPAIRAKCPSVSPAQPGPRPGVAATWRMRCRGWKRSRKSSRPSPASPGRHRGRFALCCARENRTPIVKDAAASSGARPTQAQQDDPSGQPERGSQGPQAGARAARREHLRPLEPACQLSLHHCRQVVMHGDR